MMEPETATEICAALVERARRAGADGADAVLRANAAQSVTVRLGKLEEVERSEGEGVGLRVFCGQRSASVNGSDFSDAALDDLVERAVAMARAAPEDDYAGLVPAEALATGDLPELDLLDESDLSPETLRERAEAVEDAARAIAGVTNSNGGSAEAARSVAALATSEGFARGYAGSAHSLSASMIAGEGADKQTDYAARSARYLADLPDPEEIGELAARRAVARLRPASLPSGPMPVVFDRRVANGLLGHLVSAMSAPAIARGGSFLKGRADEAIFPASIRILENPHTPRGLRSRPFDGEGVATAERALVEGGRVTGWLTNRASARQLDLPLTGHASRGGGGAPGVSVANVHLEAGSVSPEALIEDIADGVLVTSVFGQGVNAITGDYSRGATGFRIRNGELAGAVAEFTIAGNLLAMFGAMMPADDLVFERGIEAPSVRIDGMTVAGE